MSKTTWNILGVLTVMAGILLFMSVPERIAALTPEQRPTFIAGGGLILAVLGVIASACFFPKSRPVTLRILGAIGIASCIFTLIEGAHQENFSRFPVTIGFWLPVSVYLVVKGKMT